MVPLARKKRLLKLHLVLASVAASLLLGEGALRFLLFSQTARDLGIGWRLRNEALYTAPEAGRESWKLRALLDEHGIPPRSPYFDARFGWLRDGIDPATLATPDEAVLDGRRPVLLFGDSYAQCVAEAGVCWEDLLETSELSGSYRLLNYGVAGYGLDQVRLLMEPVLDRFRDRNPLVVIGILVDDDLDRAYLPLRRHPKPTFRLEDGELVLNPVEHQDAAAYLDDHPLRIRSYLCRWLMFGSGLVSRPAALSFTDEADHVAVKQAINRRLLREIRNSLDARQLSYFVLLFQARRAMQAPGLYGWQEPFLHRSLAQMRMPFVTAKRFLRAQLAEKGGTVDDFFFRSGGGANHYTRLANTVAFEALLAGIEGRFEGSIVLAGN